MGLKRIVFDDENSRARCRLEGGGGWEDKGHNMTLLSWDEDEATGGCPVIEKS
jgi:hypothetical protein